MSLYQDVIGNALYNDVMSGGAYDIVGGAEDIVGGGYDISMGQQFDPVDAMFGNARYPMMVGADPGALGLNDQQMMQALATRNAGALVPRQATKARKYILGLPTTTIAAGVTVSINANPQVPFRPKRFLIPNVLAPLCRVESIQIGKNPIFAAANPVPGEAFSPLVTDGELYLDTAQIAQQISVQVTNTSLASFDFNACFFGSAIE
jgi:hypothetical protein